MKKIIMLFFVVLLSGCAGQMAVTKKTMEFNMDVVDNRYGRGGVTILMIPVYALTTLGDYFIFNPIEFWGGRNVITDKPSIYDAPGKDYIKVNHKLDKKLTKAPVNI